MRDMQCKAIREVVRHTSTCEVAAQDAKTWWQRNKVEEGGGGYLGYGWDSAIWGVNVQLAALTNNSAPQWAAEARPQATRPPSTRPALRAVTLQFMMLLTK